MEKIGIIDRDSEIIGLSMENKSLKKHLSCINKDEEIKWFQKSKENKMLEGYSLTAYFMAELVVEIGDITLFVEDRKIISFKGIITFFCMLPVFITHCWFVGMTYKQGFRVEEHFSGMCKKTKNIP
jgi:hypothetical protein